jgi:hypothetical protein
MIALGLACENVAMIVGQPWTGLWLIFWVITNVSTSFYDIELGMRIARSCMHIVFANRHYSSGLLPLRIRVAAPLRRGGQSPSLIRSSLKDWS